MTKIINLDHVSFGYAKTDILTDVSLSVDEGEWIAVIGPNGGGKTTLLRLIMGFLSPQSGSLTVFGHEPMDGYHGLAYVPQRLPFDRRFPVSVLEVVLEGRLYCLPWHGNYTPIDRAAAYSALNRVGMVDFCHHAFGDLSGGQMQRVLIARALASDPKLLLLDEPTSSLDVNTQNEIYSIMESLRGEMTILMVTHDLHATIKRVDRVFCVQGSCISLNVEEVCEHFSMGLYHPPLLAKPGEEG